MNLASHLLLSITISARRSGSPFSFSYVCIEGKASEPRYDLLVNCDDIEAEINASINRLIHTFSNSSIL